MLVLIWGNKTLSGQQDPNQGYSRFLIETRETSLSKENAFDFINQRTYHLSITSSFCHWTGWMDRQRKLLWRTGRNREKPEAAKVNLQSRHVRRFVISCFSCSSSSTSVLTVYRSFSGMAMHIKLGPLRGQNTVARLLSGCCGCCFVSAVERNREFALFCFWCQMPHSSSSCSFSSILMKLRSVGTNSLQSNADYDQQRRKNRRNISRRLEFQGLNKRICLNDCSRDEEMKIDWGTKGRFATGNASIWNGTQDERNNNERNR